MKANTHRYLFGTSALMACLALPTHAFAGPQDGNVTAGNANIDVVGNTTTINQSSDRAIIRWKSFDIDSIETVKFNQPNSGSITVNRINDTKASRIDGKISANGNIILINPNGLVFGAGSTVDVGGLVATTSDLENDNAFMAGGAAKFTKPGNADGRIVNNGSMTVRDGGLIGLVAPHVENHGIIQARLGKAILASGDIHTIDFAGDGLIKLEVSDDVTSQSVTNTGTIIADGGQVLVTAAQARGMVDALITNTGTIRANTVNINGVEKRGSITLSTKGIDITIPRGSGMVFNTGTIQAEGLNLLDSGGIITILSDKINIGDGSYVTASGDLNGGTIKIGGNYQGGSGLPTSDMIYVGASAILNAESRRAIGDGGTIILWSDTNTRFYGYADVSGLNGGLIEVSSKGVIDVGGTFEMKAHGIGGKDGVLLLDPTDITISNAANATMNAASPFSSTADNGSSVLNITTLQAALASGNVIVQTRATGVQTGAITVSNALTWSSGNTLTLDAHGAIVVNAAISAGAGSLTLQAGGDVALNAAVSGTGTLTIQQNADAVTMGVGASAAGTLNLNATDLGNITDGWGNIVLGRATSTVATDVRAATWNDNLTIRSNTGVITFTGVTNVGANNLTIITGADIVMTAGNLTGTGDLTITQSGTGVTMGLAGGAGTVNLTAAEIGRITNGWNNIILGRTDSTVALTSSTVTWNDNVTFQNGTGLINFSNTQTVGANNITINTDGDISMGATNTLTGTGNLIIYNNTASTTIGIGGGAGTINLTATEQGRITNGWANITIGRTDGTGAITVGAVTWSDNIALQTGSGLISFTGAQAMGGNTLTVRSDTKASIGATITGTGTYNFTTNANNISFGIGDSQAGTHNYTNADLALLATTGTISFGRTDSTADMNVGAYTWLASTVFQTGTGALNINGAQTMAAKNVTLRTDSNVNINAAITSTGTFLLTQSSAATSMGILDGQAGTVHLSDAENTLLGTTWTSRVFGRVDGTGALNVGAATWVDPMTFRTGTGALNINGAQTMAANALTISTDSDLYIGGNLTGTTTLTIQQSGGATLALGTGQTGAIQIDNTEFARIVNGWTLINLGSTTSTGGMNIGTSSWVDPLTMRTGAGAINVNGTVNMAANALIIYADGDVGISGALTGTGALTFAGTTVSTSIAAGNDATGTLHLSATDLNNITDGWTTIVLGTTSTTGAVNVGTTTWKDNTIFRTTTGIISIVGTMNGLANTISISSDSNTVLAGNLVGTGTLAIYGTGNGTTMGIGDSQTGTVNLTNAELNFIQDGWGTVVFGKTGMTGIMNVGGRAWTDSVILRTNGGAMNLNGILDMGANNLTLSTNSNLALTQNLIGTGVLTFMTSAVATTMGIGTGQAGTLQLSDTELAFIQDGWNSIVFGTTTQTGAMNIGARTWTDSVEYRLLGTATNLININGAQNMGANNLTIRTDFDPVINAALTGTGNLSFYTIAASKTMAVGAGAGVVSISDAELNLITNGWNSIYFGNSAQTGAMTVTVRTWNDNVTFNTSTGVITISGDQNAGANNLTITTGGNLTLNANLIGTGTVSIVGNAIATTMGVGTSAAGTVLIDNTELARIVNGWGNIVFGRTDATGAMEVRVNTWQDNVTFQTGTGVLTIAGAQTTGANNLTIATNSNLVLNANLIGTGNLVIRAASGLTGLAVGTGQTGTVLVDNTELARITNGWGKVTFGATDQLGAVNIGAYTWNDVTYFLAAGNVVVNGTQTSTEASGTSLVFATTNGAFINNAGASAINPGGGRYLVYSVDQSSDTLGGLVALNVVNPASYAGYGPASVVETGNVFLYSGATAKIIYVQIDDIDKIYGSGLPTFTYTYLGGLQGADTLGGTILSTAYIAAGSSVFDNAGTTRTVTGNFTMGNGYSITYVNGTMTVIQATLTVTVDSDTRVYGDANPAIGVSYAGFKNGDDETDIDTLGAVDPLPGLTANVNTYATTASGDIDNNYTFNYVNGSLTVTKAALVATAQNTSKTYGDANPTFTFAYSGFKNGDTAVMIDTGALGATTATTMSNVNTYTITGSGAVDNNYSFSYVSGTLTVNKAVLTATADNKSRTYGDANPALTVSYTGFKGSDTLGDIDTAATATTAATITSNANTYAINASGGVDNNYSFSYVGGTLTVNKAVLTATASSTTKVYGDANPALTVSYSGFKNSDVVGDIDTAATASTTALTMSNVGNYATTASGGVDNNYSFNYVNGNLAVTKATLTATASSTSRVYGDANPALTVSYSGFKGSDVAGDIDTAATASTTANLLSNVGSYTTTATGGVDNNYNFSYVAGSLAVTKATLNATASSTSRVYGDANPALTVSYSGFRNSDGVGDIDTQATASTAATILSNVGAYATTASGATDNNYNFNYIDGSLGITKATLTATASSTTKVYGDANPALTVSYTGFKNSDVVGDIDTAAMATTAATVFSNVGNYATTASGGVDNNYNFSYVAGNLAVTKATLTATASSTTKVYGDTNPALTVSYSGFRNSDVVGDIDTTATASTLANNLSNVGSYATTAAGGVDNNYSFSYVDGSLAVTKAMLTATASSASRVYGDANPALTVSYTGFKNSDAVGDIDTAVTATTAAILTSNVGSYATTASGGVDNNYNFTYVDGALAVTKATLTATASSTSREYGDANPALTVSYSGFKNTDTIGNIDTAATASTTATNFSNVGSYATTAAGGVDNNYNFAYVDGSLVITKATLNATASNGTREYGDANPALTVSYSGFKNSDTVGDINTLASASTLANNFSNAGTYATTGSGGVDNNYNFNYIDGILTVTKATLTATAADATRTYGNINPAIGVIYTGFKNGEDASVLNTQATAGSSATSGSNAGGYSTTASGAFDNNYNFTYIAGLLTVNKAMLTATASSASREYGDANPALTVSYSGFVNSDVVGDLDTAATAATIANNFSNVGSYATTAGGGLDNNYNFTYVDGSLAVTKATLTATASSTSRAYGDANPAMTVSYSGFKNTDTSSDINTLATASSVANNASNVGSYATTATGGIDNNYNFTYVDGTLAVNKAMLTATASSTTKVYGDANPALTVSYSGFKNGQNASVIDTGATASSAATVFSNVGSYATTATGGVDNNYDFTYVDGTLAISKATLTATASGGSREFGDANPALTVSYSGFKNSDVAGDIDTAATAATLADNLSNVGSYATTASGGIDNNYQFTYVNGSLAVTKAMLTATASSTTKVYGDANPALTVSYSGFKNTDTASVINTGATASTAANALSNVGSYATTASGASDNNYDFTYVDGTLGVTKAMLTATASNGSRAYGDANPALTVSYSGFKNSQNASVIDTAATASSAANATSGAGTYATTASGASDGNYDFTYVDGTLTVNKATLTATASSASREYGDANPALTVSYSGFKNGETAGVINTGATAISAANSISNVGTYSTVASGASDDNYSFTYVNGALNVTKAMLTVNAGNGTKVYGDANPTIGVTYTGFKNGETSAVINTLATASSAANALSNVGSYTTTSSGGADNNYDFTHVGTGTLSVTKATLTTYADNQTRKQYEVNPTFTVTYSGFRNGDTTSVLDTGASASTLASPSSAIGSYDITASGGLDNNYSFVYVTGTLTVLDPDYIPPPPASTSTLPSTVQQTLTPNTHNQSVVNQSMYHAAVNASTSHLDNIHKSPLADNVVVITPEEDFDYLWSQDPFLIALTQTIEDYFELIKIQN